LTCEGRRNEVAPTFISRIGKPCKLAWSIGISQEGDNLRNRGFRTIFSIAIAAGVSLVGAQIGFGQAKIHVGKKAGQTARTYTANYRTSLVKTLANGVNIIHSAETIEARDAEGRTRNENASLSGNPDVDFHRITVFDPTTHTRMNWNNQVKRVTVSTISASGSETSQPCTPVNKATPPPNPVKDEIKHESLGAKTIFGIEASGMRTIRTVPTGAVGNDAPLVTVTEDWSAPGFLTYLEQHSDNPEEGKWNRELTNLTLGDPDPSLFKPPADYEVVQQEAPVACTNSPHPATGQPQSN